VLLSVYPFRHHGKTFALRKSDSRNRKSCTKQSANKNPAKAMLRFNRIFSFSEPVATTKTKNAETLLISVQLSLKNNRKKSFQSNDHVGAP